MIVSLIVAAAENDVIGVGGALPWHLPEDLRRFRRLTLGHVVVLGRVTHESILAQLGKPLPRRTSIVISRAARINQATCAPAAAATPTPSAPPAAPAPSPSPSPSPPGDGQVRWVTSVADALALASALTGAAGGDEIFVAGGVSIYAATLSLADRVYLTRVHAEVDGDRCMPAGWLAGFGLARTEPVEDPAATLPYEWLDYERDPDH